MPYTLITGASKGIGKSMAMECAKMHQDLILAALPDDGLECVAQEIANEYSVDVKTYPLDVTNRKEVEAFYEWCKNHKLAVNVLINNAGMGLQGQFCILTLEENLQMMNLNMQSMVTLTHTFIPMLKEQKESYILNVGSLASYLKFPYKAVYSGTKNFVLAFSDALRQELKNTSISVSCLCPGPTMTNHLVAARTEEQGLKAKLLIKSASFVAEAGVEGLFKGKRTIIPGKFNRLLIFLIKHLPSSTSTRVAEKMFANAKEK